MALAEVFATSAGRGRQRRAESVPINHHRLRIAGRWLAASCKQPAPRRLLLPGCFAISSIHEYIKLSGVWRGAWLFQSDCDLPWRRPCVDGPCAEPTKIRIGTPDQSLSGKPSAGTSTLTLLYVRKGLEEEFAKDGIQVEWSFSKALARPSMRRSPTSNSTLFSWATSPPSSDAPMDCRPGFLAGTRGSNTFLAVTPESQIKTVADLKRSARRRPQRHRPS